ncbi:MAG: hypothetical protein Q4E13_13880, partial [Clostridia bacterium]|nr:hypothetical protein [Clostridia bacterium]
MKKKIGIDLFNEVSMISHLTYNGSYYFIGKTGNPVTNGYDSNLYTLNGDGEARPLTSSNDVKDFFLTDEGVVFPSLRKPADRESAAKGRPLTVYQLLPFIGGEAVEAFRLPYIVEQIVPLGNGKYFFKALYDHNLQACLDACDGDWDKALAMRKEERESCTVLDEMQFRFNGAGYINKLRHVLGYFDGQDCKLLTDLFGSVGRLVLSEDKKQLLFSQKVYKVRTPLYSDLCLLDVDTLSIRTVNEQYTCQIRGYAFDGADHAIVLANPEVDGQPTFDSPDMVRMRLSDGSVEVLIPGGPHNYGGAVG